MKIMKKFIFTILVIIGIVTISCSHNTQKDGETAQIEEEEFGSLCCPVEEAPADTLDFVAPIP